MAKPVNKIIENEDKLFHFVDNNAINSEKITAPRYSYWKSVFRVFFRKKANWLILFVLVLLLAGVIIIPEFIPYDLNENTLVLGSNLLNPKEAQEFFGEKIKYCLGTGQQGESIFAAIWAGGRTSIKLSTVCAAINMTIGVLIGVVWGYSKRLDNLLTFIYNVIANVPYILLISVLVFVIGAGFWPFVFALTVTGWLGIAYFFRTQVMIIRSREYNLASKCLGTPLYRIITKNILPFMTSVIVTVLAAELPAYISMEVFLSYIGVGLDASIPSIGRMISEAPSFTEYPWAFWSPVAISSIITFVLYVLGQNLADASDPRTHR